MLVRIAAPVFLALGFALYAPSLGVPFVWDDSSAIAKNPNVRVLWPLSEAMSAPPTAPVAGRPTTSLTLALSYAAGGMSPASFRVGNLAVHILTGLALFGVVRRSLASPRLPARSAGEIDALAFACALLWLVHPLGSEVIGYVTQRSDALMSLFLLLTLYASMRAQSAPSPAWARRWQLAAVAACALGMGSKEVMVVAPVVVLVHDQVLFAGTFGAALRNRPALYAGLAATWALLAILVLTGPDYQTMRMGFSLGVSPIDYLLAQGIVISHYLRLVVWPVQQILDYGDYAPVTLAESVLPSLWVAACFVASVFAYASGWRRDLRARMAIGFLGLCFFAILSPTSSVVPVVGEVGAERRMHLPLAAPLLMIVLGGTSLLRERIGRAGLVAGVAICVLALSAATVTRMRDYRTTIDLWTTVVERVPRNPRGFLVLGNALRDAGRRAEAIAHFRQALRLKPDYIEAQNNLGSALYAAGEFDEAVALFEVSVEAMPGLPYLHHNLGRALVKVGRFEAAIEALRHEMSLQPVYTPAMRDVAWILATHPRAALRDSSEAVRIARRAAELSDAGGDAAVLDALAAAYASAGRFEDAVATAERALARLAPSGWEAVAVRARLALYRAERVFEADAGTAGAPLWLGPLH